jgi:hypothetical protein
MSGFLIEQDDPRRRDKNRVDRATIESTPP